MPTPACPNLHVFRARGQASETWRALPAPRRRPDAPTGPAARSPAGAAPPARPQLHGPGPVLAPVLPSQCLAEERRGAEPDQRARGRLGEGVGGGVDRDGGVGGPGPDAPPTPGGCPHRGDRAWEWGAAEPTRQRPRGSASAAESQSWGQRRAGATRGGPDGRLSSPAGQVSCRRVARVALRGGAVVVHRAGCAEGCGQQLHRGQRPGGRRGRIGGLAGGPGPGRRRRAGCGAGSQRARLELELPPLPSAPAGGRARARAWRHPRLPRQRGWREGRARRGRGRAAKGRGSRGRAQPRARGRGQPLRTSHPARASPPGPGGAGESRAACVGAGERRPGLPAPSSPPGPHRLARRTWKALAR